MSALRALWRGLRALGPVRERAASSASEALASAAGAWVVLAVALARAAALPEDRNPDDLGRALLQTGVGGSLLLVLALGSFLAASAVRRARAALDPDSVVGAGHGAALAATYLVVGLRAASVPAFASAAAVGLHYLAGPFGAGSLAGCFVVLALTAALSGLWGAAVASGDDPRAPWIAASGGALFGASVGWLLGARLGPMVVARAHLGYHGPLWWIEFARDERVPAALQRAARWAPMAFVVPAVAACVGWTRAQADLDPGRAWRWAERTFAGGAAVVTAALLLGQRAGATRWSRELWSVCSQGALLLWGTAGLCALASAPAGTSRSGRDPLSRLAAVVLLAMTACAWGGARGVRLLSGGTPWDALAPWVALLAAAGAWALLVGAASLARDLSSPAAARVAVALLVLGIHAAPLTASGAVGGESGPLPHASLLASPSAYYGLRAAHRLAQRRIPRALLRRQGARASGELVAAGTSAGAQAALGLALWAVAWRRRRRGSAS